MQRIMEPIFEIPYLMCAVILGILTLKAARGRVQFTLFGIMSIVLGCGDAFHLVSRIWYLITEGTTALPSQAAALGFGKLVTSITMTLFYVLLYHVWQARYEVPKNNLITCTVYFLAAVRIILCLMPQNRWLEVDSPLNWGIYRNIPFVILGILLIYLYYRESRKSCDKSLYFMWAAVALSFAFYIPVVLFADIAPPVGMLMIPKTCAYMWIIIMGYRDAKKTSVDVS